MLNEEQLNFLKNYPADDLVIISDSFNLKLIKGAFSSIVPLKKYQVYSNQEFASIMLSSVSKRSILTLMNHGYSYQKAKAYVNALKLYINVDIDINSDIDINNNHGLKINFLTDAHANELKAAYDIIKSEVENSYEEIKNRLLLRFRNKTIIVASETDSLDLELSLKKLEVLDFKYQRIDFSLPKTKETLNDNQHQLIMCSDLHQEISVMMNEITKLVTLDNPVSLNDIVIIYSDDTYSANITNMFDTCHIPYYMNVSNGLYANEQVKVFFKYLKNIDITLFNDLKSLAENAIENNYLNEDIKECLINVFNNYASFPYSKELMNLILDDIKNASTPNEKKFGIRITNKLETEFKEHYFIFLGAYNDSVPTKHSYDDFYEISEYERLGLYSVAKSNKYSSDYLTNLISTSKEFIFTYSLKLNGYKMVKSLYFDNWNEVPYDDYKIDFGNCFKEYSMLSYSMLYNDYKKYGLMSKEVIAHYPLKDYQSLKNNRFINQFTGLDPEVQEMYNMGLEPLNKRKEKIKQVSYTQINTYNECPFKFYLNYYWHLPTEETRSLFIGNLFHYNMEQLVKNDIQKDDIDDAINQYTQEYLSKNIDKYPVKNQKKEDLYLSIYQNFIKEAYLFHKEFVERFSLNVYGVEKSVNIKYQIKGYDVILNGKIDKALYKGDFYIIVDYKTGELHLDFDKMEYGLNMQLPIYLNLLDEDLDHKDHFSAGCFLEQILPSKYPDADGKNSVLDLLKKNLKMNGIYPDLAELDNRVYDVKPSDFIVGSKTTYTQEEIKMFADYTNKKIKETIEKIIDGKFEISPYYLGYREYACGLCSFKGICYKRPTNYRNLKLDKKLTFIFGESEEKVDE